MKAKGLIPEGGYGEDEDAHAADEDEDGRHAQQEETRTSRL